MRNEIPLNERVIVALDINDEKAVFDIVNSLGDSINFYKVGKELFVSEGPDIVKYLNNKDKKVFLDLKFHDIPNTVYRAVKSLVNLNIDLFTIHASGGKAMIEAAVQSVDDEVKHLSKRGIFVKVPKVLAVTVLTSLAQDDLVDIGVNVRDEKWGLDMAVQVKRLASLAKEAGVDGIVASPLEVEMLREFLGEDILIVTPGIRPESAVADDDQKRTMTPKEATGKGADYLVIGRPILNAPDPKEAAEKIFSEIQ